MKILIMGCSRLGVIIINGLIDNGHEVTVIDTSEENLRRLPETHDVTMLLCDGAIDDNLRWAGIEEAGAFLALGQGDAKNAFVAQKALHRFHVPKVVCMITDPMRQEMYKELGLNALSPTKLISEMVIQALDA